jgi:hypothetical protein
MNTLFSSSCGVDCVAKCLVASGVGIGLLSDVRFDLLSETEGLMF